jgi:hypothetical protein
VIVVIQCAATKRRGAGHLLTDAGKPVKFVAHPEFAPPDWACEYARPDDGGPSGTWRQVLVSYNSQPGHNPLRLFPAYQLYEKGIYERLVKRYGVSNVYILSAGWGLIRSDFLTPYYDITFSQTAEPYKRRRRADEYGDLRMLSNDVTDKVVFFGGKDYLDLFITLTNHISSERVVFFNSQVRTGAPGGHA